MQVNTVVAILLQNGEYGRDNTDDYVKPGELCYYS